MLTAEYEGFVHHFNVFHVTKIVFDKQKGTIWIYTLDGRETCFTGQTLEQFQALNNKLSEIRSRHCCNATFPASAVL